VGIANHKLLMLSFENLFGLKINFHKSEVIVVGATQAEKIWIANFLY
jgi:hypothetical protein